MRLPVILGALAAVISVPFLLKPDAEHDPRLATSPKQVLNIITPHSESIRREFTTAFRQYMREREGIDIFIEWRVPGGTSEIEKILDTEYTFAFKHAWKNQLGKPWTPEVSAAFHNRRLTLPEDPAQDSPGESARRTFLESDIGIGLDLFFGGGAYPFVVNSGKGYLVDSGIFERQPRWFTPDIIPQEVGGEPFYDPEFRWLGTCLTTFGICINHDAIERLELHREPLDWNLLGHPKLIKEVSIADPSTSGSVTKAFEMILQQQMRRSLNAAPENEAAALERGWTHGMRLIRRIGANARYFANFAAKIPADVASGNAAVGMCIDYYGRTFHERLQDDTGRSRMQFVTPEGGSSLSVDPIAMLRGAPNRRLALKFIEFTLSIEGQQLWNLRAGTPNGPKRQALRRLPVRKDLYQPEHLLDFADPDERPFEKSHLFHYEAAWTSRAFGAIRFIIKSMCVDAHAELQEAWQALIDHDFPPVATAVFDDVTRVSYATAMGEISEVLKRSKLEQSRFARDLTQHFRTQVPSSRHAGPLGCRSSSVERSPTRPFRAPCGLPSGGQHHMVTHPTTMNPDFTRILNGLQDGKVDAAELLPVVYQELRHLATRKMARESPEHTLQPTALVHEAWLRLSGTDSATEWENRSHFFGAAAEAMRRILVDHARKKKSAKRGGGIQHEDIDVTTIELAVPPDELLAVHGALDALAHEDQTAAQLVKLRYFIGMTMEEAASVLGMKKRTAEALWTYSKIWLRRAIRSENP